MTTTPDADADARDLNIALAMIGELNRAINAADTKSGLLLAAQSAVLAGLTSRLRLGVDLPTGLRVLALLTLLAVGVAVAFIIATLWPTLRPGASQWFSFPALNAVSPRPDATGLADDGWQQVVLLASIARRKHRCFRIALGFGGFALTLFFAGGAVAVLS